MGNTFIIWALVITFLVFVFVGIYLYRLRIVADDFTKLKKLSEQNIQDRTSQFLNKMDSKQLDTLLKVINKKHKTK